MRTLAPHLGLLREGEPLDGDERVCLGVADDDPPAFLPLLRIEWGDDRPRHLVLPLQRHHHVHRVARREILLLLKGERR